MIRLPKAVSSWLGNTNQILSMDIQPSGIEPLDEETGIRI